MRHTHFQYSVQVCSTTLRFKYILSAVYGFIQERVSILNISSSGENKKYDAGNNEILNECGLKSIIRSG